MGPIILPIVPSGNTLPAHAAGRDSTTNPNRINAYKAVLAVKQYADTCQANYTNQVISAQTINRNVCTLHMENATVKNNASATFKIDTEAYLGAGFSVEKGAEFAIFPE